jgi:hypothetical protein
VKKTITASMPQSKPDAMTVQRRGLGAGFINGASCENHCRQGQERNAKRASSRGEASIDSTNKLMTNRVQADIRCFAQPRFVK